MIKFSEKYKKRCVKFSEVWEHDGWYFKVYTIALDDSKASPSLVNIAKQEAIKKINGVTLENKVYKIGIIVVHEAREADFLLINWWFNENMLNSHIYSCPKDNYGLLEYLSPKGGGMCVWELQVLCFEKSAWINHVLLEGSVADFHGYLNCRFNGWI